MAAAKAAVTAAAMEEGEGTGTTTTYGAVGDANPTNTDSAGGQDLEPWHAPTSSEELLYDAVHAEHEDQTHLAEETLQAIFEADGVDVVTGGEGNVAKAREDVLGVYYLSNWNKRWVGSCARYSGKVLMLLAFLFTVVWLAILTPLVLRACSSSSKHMTIEENPWMTIGAALMATYLFFGVLALYIAGACCMAAGSRWCKCCHRSGCESTATGNSKAAAAGLDETEGRRVYIVTVDGVVEFGWMPEDKGLTDLKELMLDAARAMKRKFREMKLKNSSENRDDEIAFLADKAAKQAKQREQARLHKEVLAAIAAGRCADFNQFLRGKGGQRQPGGKSKSSGYWLKVLRFAEVQSQQNVSVKNDANASEKWDVPVKIDGTGTGTEGNGPNGNGKDTNQTGHKTASASAISGGAWTQLDAFHKLQDMINRVRSDEIAGTADAEAALAKIHLAEAQQNWRSVRYNPTSWDCQGECCCCLPVFGLGSKSKSKSKSNMGAAAAQTGAETAETVTPPSSLSARERREQERASRVERGARHAQSIRLARGEQAEEIAEEIDAHCCTACCCPAGAGVDAAWEQAEASVGAACLPCCGPCGPICTSACNGAGNHFGGVETAWHVQIVSDDGQLHIQRDRHGGVQGVYWIPTEMMRLWVDPSVAQEVCLKVKQALLAWEVRKQAFEAALQKRAEAIREAPAETAEAETADMLKGME